MSDSAKPEDAPEKRRRRRRENGDVKNQIRIVSSLGEGKLLDRFQSAVSEKEKKKKNNAKNEKMRQIHKEKREREVAKFKAEINALLEEDTPSLKPSEKMTTFVPKMKGTVKGKFEELERKKQEEEKKKAENERKRRNEKDMRERKRIEIELAKKKLQEKQDEIENDIPKMKSAGSPRKTPGKLNASDFEDMTRMREEKERKKTEMERRMKMEAERRAFRENSAAVQSGSSETEDEVFVEPKEKPGKLTTKFDEIARAREEKQRKKTEEENKRKLEEEKRVFREAKMAAVEDDSESKTSKNGNSDKAVRKPSRLSDKLTKFDVIEKERIEDERRRIQERRKKLLEEEMRIFEESKNSLAAEEQSSEEEQKEKDESSRQRRPRRLDSSFTQFDIMTRQKLQEKREEIQKERAKLLEDEKRMFAEQRSRINEGSSESPCSSSANTDSVSGSEKSNKEPSKEETVEKKKKKFTKRRKKQKVVEDKPSKLDTTKLKFDVLERQRMEKERWQIQEQRRKLLEEEKRMFEEARKQRLENQENDASDEEHEDAPHGEPSKLGYAKTRFDIMAQHKMEEERNRIREERARLLREEKKLFEEERRKLKEQEKIEEDPSNENSFTISSKKPNRLDKSFTEFDILAKKRKEEESEKIMKESQRKLEEEKKMFKEAKQMMMEESEDSGDEHPRESSYSRTPQKLSKSLTDFEEMERQRSKDERNHAYREKLFQLEQEKKLFAEARKLQEQDSGEDEEDVENRKLAQISSNKLSFALSKFEQTEEMRTEKERMKLQEKKIKEMEEELKRFQEERELMNDSDREEKRDTPAPQVKQPRPRKLASSFTKFDEIARMRQEEERRKMREDKARELAEERRRFQKSKEAEDESESGSDEEESETYRPITRINVRQQMEAVLKAQKEIEQKRIMETKFCRMTVEQQEMYLAKERQLQLLQEKLAQAEAEYESYTSEEYTEEEEDSSDEEYSSGDEQRDSEICKEQNNNGKHQASQQHSSGEDSRCSPQGVRDDTSTPGSNDSGYTGAPWFTETLSNVTLTEGQPVRFDAEIYADPHPKVTWYFQNRLIRNSPDYQYMNKGTQYSLYMNESFVDDAGEYICKAENNKGVATSKAILTVNELPE